MHPEEAYSLNKRIFIFDVMSQNELTHLPFSGPWAFSQKLHVDCGPERQRQVKRHRLHVVRIWIPGTKNPFQEDQCSHSRLGEASGCQVRDYI